MKVKVRILASVALLVVMAAGWLALSGGPPRLNSKARRQWKDDAIRQISEKFSDRAWLTNEIQSLRSKPATDSEWENWISSDLILMTNGDWVVYRNVCWKEPSHIPDLFLGRASDGKWYYSTFHFCIRMIVLKDMLGQPESLANFATNCYLREFDGHSDDCLKSTWPLEH
jgi:hypothetical protein